MVLPRLIVVMLIDRSRRVVKTVGFGERTYVGDPFNIIRLFNEKEVDEICVLDIDASADGREPDFDLVTSLASECFMPLSYGGGISTIQHARRLVADGVEKLVLRSHTSERLIGEIAEAFGVQALVGCLDYRVDGASRTTSTGKPLEQEAARLAKAGVGEIILQSIDRDGLRTGMDIEGIAAIAPGLDVPVIALGGAGEVAHLDAALGAGADAAASGSAFAFIGRLRAVLITYPDYETRLQAKNR
ncbi:imidazole glycerol phosphate synthase,subunit [Sphingopyxis fribergensis]|uniref:Imidazole glycerol phosphate synthase subunit HisF n=1 Tax=Sphingopyxis fribergensis TaxID=1515612 RepID=A0A0A7PG78_9SPHN|nr:HisA/HisF-related TIM barrel protein [Sphingopyxis fribergensis]AJA09015.1 imidazole glycerol phosphate synthase,subunit [Sphingopyxis fribergensis]